MQPDPDSATEGEDASELHRHLAQVEVAFLPARRFQALKDGSRRLGHVAGTRDVVGRSRRIDAVEVVGGRIGEGDGER